MGYDPTRMKRAIGELTRQSCFERQACPYCTDFLTNHYSIHAATRFDERLHDPALLKRLVSVRAIQFLGDSMYGDELPESIEPDPYGLIAYEYPVNGGPTSHESIRYNNEVEGSLLEDLVKSVVRKTKETKALDIGVGPGRVVKLLRSLGISDVTAIDKNDEMLKAAEKTLRKEGIKDVKFVQGDAQELPFAPGTFDLITAGFCDPIEDQKRAWRAFHHVLKRAGWVIATYPDRHLNLVLRPLVYGIDPNTTRFKVERDGASTHPCSSRLYDPKELMALVESAGFVNIFSGHIAGLDPKKLEPPRAFHKAAKIMGLPITAVPIVTLIKAQKRCQSE